MRKIVQCMFLPVKICEDRPAVLVGVTDGCYFLTGCIQ